LATNEKEVQQKEIKRYFQNLLDYYKKSGWRDSYIGQAIVVLAICAFGGIIFILFYSFQTPDIIAVFGSGVLIGGASFFLGGFLGFLFGIPKTIKQQPQTTTSSTGSPVFQQQFLENTNLEDISDWLTKIIIGVGLVELTQIPSLLNQYSVMISPALGGMPSSGAFGIALLVFYSIIGFLVIYLATRRYMDDELQRKRDQWLASMEIASKFTREEFEQMDNDRKMAIIREYYDQLHQQQSSENIINES
jgi:hypothetical protein